MAAKTASLSVNIIADAAKAKAGLREAETAFGKFRREVSDAQGTVGKFQSMAGGAFDYVKQNAMTFAAAAGAAVATFVVTSIKNFQDLAITLGKFSDATGFSTEEASRLVEVAGDIGIEIDTLQRSLGFMNKTLGNNAGAFEDLGIQIAYTSGGAVDANQTFLNVVDRLKAIKDPAEKAAAGAKILGRNWQSMAELIAMGSDELTKSLQSVSDQKVFTKDEVNKARDLRDSFEELKDRIDDFSGALSQKMIPILTDAIDLTTKFFDVFKVEMPLIGGTIGSRFGDALEWTLLRPIKLGKIAVDFLTDAFGNNKDELTNYIPVTEEMARVWSEGYTAMINGRTAADELSAALRNQAEDVDLAKTKWDEFKGSLNFNAEYLRIEENITKFSAKWAGATDEAKRKNKEYQQELLTNQTMLANFAGSIVGVATTAQNNVIRFYTQTGQLWQALSLINAIKAGLNDLAGRVTPDRVERITGGLMAPTSSSGITSNQSTVPTRRIPGLASGGTVTAGGMALVGENGPELLTLPRGASVNPNIGAGQTVINIRVDAGLVSSPDQVGQQIIEAIKRAQRRSGQVFAGV